MNSAHQFAKSGSNSRMAVDGWKAPGPELTVHTETSVTPPQPTVTWVGQPDLDAGLPPGPRASAEAVIHAQAEAETLQNQLDSTLERLKREREVSNHELGMLRTTVADLEGRISQLMDARTKETLQFDAQTKEQDALLYRAQKDLTHVTKSAAKPVAPVYEGTDDDVAVRPFTKSNVKVLLKRISVLEQYRDRTEEQLDIHRQIVDSRVAAITAARNAAFTSIVSLQKECEAQRKVIVAQAADITKLTEQKQVVRQSLRFVEAQQATEAAKNAKLAEAANLRAGALEAALQSAQNRLEGLVRERDSALMSVAAAVTPNALSKEAIAVKDAKIAALTLKLDQCRGDAEEAAGRSALEIGLLEDRLRGIDGEHAAVINGLQTEMESLRNQLAAARSEAAAAANATSAQIQGLQTLLASVTAELESARTSAESTFKSTCDNMRVKFEQVQRASQDALELERQQRLDSEAQQVAKAQAVELELEAARTRVQALHQQLCNNTVALEAEVTLRLSLEAQLSACQQEVAQLHARCHALQIEIDSTPVTVAAAPVAMVSAAIELQMCGPFHVAEVPSSPSRASTFVSSVHSDSFDDVSSPGVSTRSLNRESTLSSVTPNRDGLSRVESGSTLSSAVTGEPRSERKAPRSAHVPHGSPPSEDMPGPDRPQSLVIDQPSFDPADPTPCVLGIDLGTTTVKVVVISKETSRILASVDEVTHAYVTNNDNGTPFAEQDVTAILASLQRCLQRLPSTLLSRVARVGVAGQMHGIVLWRSDKPLTHVSRLITWEDQRVTPEFLQELCAAPASERARELIRQLKPGFGCATLASLCASSAALVDKFTSAGSIMDYVVSLLTGKSAVMEPTVAHSWGLFDLDTQSWSVEAARACGVPTRLLPHVVHETTVVGTVSKEAVKMLGVALSEDCEVFVAHGDHPCTVLTALRNGAAAAVSVGTSAQVAVPVHPKEILALLPSATSPGAVSRLFATAKLGYGGKLVCRLMMVLVSAGTLTLTDFTTIDTAALLFGMYGLLEFVYSLFADLDATTTDSNVVTKPTSTAGWELRPYFNGKSMVVGAAMNGGNALAELVHTLASWAEFGSAGPCAVDEALLYAKLDASIATVKSDRQSSLVVRPTFLPERWDATESLASITNIGPGQLADVPSLFQSWVKGLAVNLTALLPSEIVTSMIQGRPVAVSGGAVLRSKSLQAALQETLGCSSLEVCSEADAAFGAACLHADSKVGTSPRSLGEHVIAEGNVSQRARARRKVVVA